MTTTLFTNAHIATGEPGSTAASTLPLQDILVTDGVFTAFGPGLAQQYEAQGGDLAAIEVVDLGGKLVCPPFCDTHLHLDYVFTARKPGAVNESGTLFEGIQRWSETKSDLTVDEIKQRAKIGIKKEMLHGVQLIRSHADVTDPNLTSLKALLELKEELKDTVTLQIVSFPQEGMYSYEGPHGESGAELVEEGLKMGADCVGGIPHFEQCREFGEHSMHTVVELASKYDKLIDVHCDETDDPNSRYVELLSALAGPLVNLICGAAFCSASATAARSWSNCWSIRTSRATPCSRATRPATPRTAATGKSSYSDFLPATTLTPLRRHGTEPADRHPR